MGRGGAGGALDTPRRREREPRDPPVDRPAPGGNRLTHPGAGGRGTTGGHTPEGPVPHASRGRIDRRARPRKKSSIITPTLARPHRAPRPRSRRRVSSEPACSRVPGPGPRAPAPGPRASGPGPAFDPGPRARFLGWFRQFRLKPASRFFLSFPAPGAGQTAQPWPWAVVVSIGSIVAASSSCGTHGARPS